MAVNSLIIFLFRNPQAPASQLFLRLGLSGAGYLLLAAVLHGQKAALFDPDRYAAQGEEYAQALKKLGSAPIKMIPLTRFLRRSLWARSLYKGKRREYKRKSKPLFFRGFFRGHTAQRPYVRAYGNLASETLLSRKLHAYPLDLRENRQTLKVLLTPAIVGLLSVFFASCMTILAMHEAGISLVGIHPSARRTAFILIGVFFVVVVLVVSAEKKNNEKLFKSIIV
ncbi:MAG: hypothetical protein LBB48_06195 [Treponema sp.]|nr:hypothetical protein [Treponema sp.]